MKNIDGQSTLVNGDPPIRIFALVFLGVLMIAIAGVVAAIAAGNISHYRYFTTPHISSVNATALNLSSSKTMESDRLWLSTEERRFAVKSKRRISQKWLITIPEEHERQ